MFLRTRLAVFALAASLIVALPVSRAGADTVSDKAREAGQLTTEVDAAKQRAGELGADYLRAMERSADADAAAANARARLANAKARESAVRDRVSAVAVDLYISGATDTGAMLRQAFGTNVDGPTSVYIDTAADLQNALVQDAADAKRQRELEADRARDAAKDAPDALRDTERAHRSALSAQDDLQHQLQRTQGELATAVQEQQALLAAAAKARV